MERTPLRNRVMTRGTTALCLAVLAIGSTSRMRAADPAEWSRFRGPNGTGISSSTGLPAEFGPSTNVVWKAAVPAGHSSPVLTTAQIFLTAYEGDRLLVLAFDRKNGREQWRREVPRHQKGHLDGPNSPASPSPVSDGERVYTFFQDVGPHGVRRRRKGVMARPSRPVQHVLRIRRIADSRGRHRRARR